MKTIDLKVSKRPETGKKATRELRKQGKVPCVLYGGEDLIHFTAESKEFKNLIYTPHVYLLNLDIDGDVHQAILQDAQFHPVSDKILHLDFLKIFEDKPIKIRVPLQVEGFSKGVQAGGKLKIEIRKLLVRALPKDLPDHVTVDVTDVALGQSVKIRDMKFDNLELLDPQSAVAISVKTTRVSKSMLDILEGDEAEEAETLAEGEEGDEAASDGESED